MSHGFGTDSCGDLSCWNVHTEMVDHSSHHWLANTVVLQFLLSFHLWAISCFFISYQILTAPAKASASLGTQLPLVCESFPYVKQTLWNPHLIYKDVPYLVYGSYKSRSWVSSGSIVSDYGQDDQAIGVRSLAGQRIFPLCPDRLWGPPSLLSNGYRGSFPRK
jgi:hypothetical protein